MSGLYLYCTELCAVCIHSHSVESCSDSQKISTVLHSCGSLCKWQFLIMSSISIQSHAVQNQAFQISQHSDPLPACISKNMYSHLSRAMWEYTFWSIAESISPITTKSHTVKLQISCSVSITAAYTPQIFSAGTDFDLTLYSGNLSFCQHWINHGQILSRPCLCFLGGAGSRGPQ